MDITIRNPVCPSYLRVEGRSNAANVDGYTANVGVEKKNKRYPDKDGCTVVAASAETFGRLAPEFSDHLRMLHAMAQQADRDSGSEGEDVADSIC